MNADSETYPPPNEPAAFESLCLDLWKDIWSDPGARKNGPLQTPAGPLVRIRTVWIIETGRTDPRFVTAFPG